MSIRPLWLPGLVSINGDPKEVFQRLYDVFYQDFHVDGCRFCGLSVNWDRRREPGDLYEEGFWHLITKFDSQQAVRLMDPRRAERLPWCRPVILHHADPVVKVWEYKQGKHRRTYVWLEQEDYVVVLQRRRTQVFLVTAFYVEGSQTRRKLQRQFENRLR